MASTKWNVGVSGNWTTVGDWSAGAPNAGTDVTIGAVGTYSVALTSNVSAQSLTINASGALLSESVTGVLNITNAFDLISGKAILRGANSIGGGVAESGGVLQTANNGALGTGTYTFSGGELLGLANETYTNEMTMTNSLIFAAAAGTTMIQDSSSWSINATDPAAIRFGQGANTGTVVWFTNSGSITNSPGLTAEIAGGTVKAGDGNWDFLFENAAKNTIDAGGTLDIAGFSGFVNNLQGAGSIIDSGATASIQIEGGGAFSGVISGVTALDANSGTLVLTGANTYTGGTTIDGGATLQLGTGTTAGTITGAITDNGTLVYDHNNALSQTAAITGTGGVTYEGGGGVTSNLVQTYSGQTNVESEKAVSNIGGGFGTGILELDSSELLVTTNATMTNSRIIVTGSSTIASAHGRTLIATAANTPWSLNGASGIATLNIGDATNDGTVVWSTGAGSTVVDIPNCFVEVHSGIFRANDGSFSFLTENVGGVTVDAGATLDFGQWGGFVVGLQGAGTVTAHNNSAIEIDGGVFSGVISGAASLEIVDGTVLSGTNTYTAGTLIDSGAALSLGAGGTTGSVVGNITDNGSLILDRSDALNENLTISGSGQLIIAGTGTVTIDHSETYTGGTIISAGELSVDRAAALSNGELQVQNGEFLVTNNIILTNQIGMTGAVTFAVATGDQVTFNSGTGWVLDGTNPTTITFGDGTNNGAIVWHTPAGSTVIDSGSFNIDVNSAVLKAGDGSFDFFTFEAASTTIGAAGSINMSGFQGDFLDLLGSGILSNTGAAVTTEIEGGNFSGHINGAFSQVQIYDAVTLTGTGNFAGVFYLGGSSDLDLSGAWAQNLQFSGASAVALHTPAQFTGQVVNFAAGDQVDVRGVDFTNAGFVETYSSTTGRVTLTDGTHTYHVTFNGTYVLGNFVASSDTHGGTDLTFTAVAEVPPTMASAHPDFAAF